MLRAIALLLFCAAPAGAQNAGPVVSGDARMGLVWQSKPGWAGQRENGLRMTSRARLKFQFTGETDGGLTYGAEISLDQDKAKPARPRVFLGGGS
ncbi:MAG: porin [Natronohydrobacter sp.]|nr:porin [Natronohydrobacter sp.]